MSAVMVTILDANMDVVEENTTKRFDANGYTAEFEFGGPDGRPWVAVVSVTDVPVEDGNLAALSTPALMQEVARRLRLLDRAGKGLLDQADKEEASDGATS